MAPWTQVKHQTQRQGPVCTSAQTEVVFGANIEPVFTKS
uniref:Uncharacterized protein n=1 Tax=Anguilla anguilla TaxID=7936 RepID=A0A0E9SXX3_ANGAN